MTKVLSSNLGYPLIGEHREWKRALGVFWAGNLSEVDFLLDMTAMFLLVPAAVQNMVAATRLVRERLVAKGSQS